MSPFTRHRIVANRRVSAIAATNIECRDWNSTSFWNTSFPCGNLTRPACSWVHGGSFNDASSTSWRAPSDPDLTDSSPGNETIRIRGTDTLNLGSDISIDQFPIYFPKPRVIPQNSLGLGPNSTFLNLLFDQGKIASKTWSLFWGWQGAEKENQMNGSLVLGGYDKAKMGGANLTAKFSDGVGCPSSLLVYLSNIAVNHADGNKTSLFSTAGSALRACIKADNPQVTLPEDVFENLKKAFPGKTVEHSTGIYPNSLAYEPENMYVPLFPHGSHKKIEANLSSTDSPAISPLLYLLASRSLYQIIRSSSQT